MLLPEVCLQQRTTAQQGCNDTELFLVWVWVQEVLTGRQPSEKDALFRAAVDAIERRRLLAWRSQVTLLACVGGGQELEHKHAGMHALPPTCSCAARAAVDLGTSLGAWASPCHCLLRKQLGVLQPPRVCKASLPAARPCWPAQQVPVMAVLVQTAALIS